MKGQGAIRRQLGTINYQEDKFGAKGPRRLEVFLPLIDPNDSNPSVASWDDDESKKSAILLEYQAQI